jgi:hypothetical protein
VLRGEAVNDFEAVFLFVLLCAGGLYGCSLGRHRFDRWRDARNQSLAPSGYSDAGRPRVADAIGDTLIDEIRQRYDGLPPLPTRSQELQERSGYRSTTITLVKR